LKALSLYFRFDRVLKVNKKIFKFIIAGIFCLISVICSAYSLAQCPVPQAYGTQPYPVDISLVFEKAGFNQLGVYGPTYYQIYTGYPDFNLRSPYVPPILLKSIGWAESKWKQFKADSGNVGPSLISFDCGYGIMQITSGMEGDAGFNPERVASEYVYNIGTGAKILIDKWNILPYNIGDNNPQIIEDWYYAVWAYNGFSWQNNPNNPIYPPNREPFNGSQFRGDYPYQELVWGYAANPPGPEFWEPVSLTLPDCSLIGIEPPPWIPRPFPFHNGAVETTPINIGDRVGITSYQLNVRYTPGGEYIDTLYIYNNPTGEVIDGPQDAYYKNVLYTWWEIRWDNGLEGWSVEDYLAVVPSSCTLNPGQGAPDQTTTNKFIEAYNLEGGEATMGCATANVDTFNNTFYSPPIAGYYQNFNDGSYGTCSIDYVPGYPSAYSIKWGFYATFMSRDSEIGQDVYTLLVAPTDNERDSSSNSVVGTVYAWQPFIKGSMYYFDDSHILDGTTFEGYFDGKITYVWGHISERYEWEGGRNGDLGLPLFDEEYYGTQDSWEWWYQWFEKGFIWFAKHSSYGEWTFAYQRTADVYSNGEWLELGWIKH
jgi:hypothetical protein